MGLSVKVTGFKELLNKFASGDYSERAINRTLAVGINSASNLILRTMRKNTPVDTSKLKDNESINIVELVARIGPSIIDTPYAPFVEFGHHTSSGSFVPGQFFVKRTFIATEGPIKILFATLIRTLIG